MTANLNGLKELQAFCEQSKSWGIVGSLIGKSLSDRNVVLEKQWEKFNAELEEALQTAKKTGKSVEFDGSGISLANGGDIWIIHPDGKMDRRFSTYPDFPKLLAGIENEDELDLDRPLPQEELFKAAFNGLWGPSATNWQPVMVVEISEPFQEEFIKHFKLKATPNPNLPLLLLLRREHYDSLLGDVMEAFGFAVTAKEESIDVGIFEEILKMSFRAKGIGYRTANVDDAMLPGAVELVRKDLHHKLDGVKTLEEKSDLIEEQLKKLRVTLDFLNQGKYFPDVLFQVGYPKGGAEEVCPDFDQLTLERTTQRVASPTGDVSEEQLKSVLDNCLNSMTPQDREAVHISHFTWNDNAVIEIGGGDV